MKIGVRGHDLSCGSVQDFCHQVKELGVHHVQLALGKSFPEINLTADAMMQIAAMLKKNEIHVSVLSCYIDPLTPEGEETFLRFLENAVYFSPDVVATETATRVSKKLETPEYYEKMCAVAKRFAAAAETLQVHFAFEAVKGMPLCSPSVMKKLVDDVNSPWFKLVLDPANLIDAENEAMQAEVFSQVLRECGEDIAVIHDKALPNINCEAVFAFAKEHPSVTVVTEGLCGVALTRELNQLASL